MRGTASDGADPSPDAREAGEGTSAPSAALWAVPRGPIGERVTERLRRRSARLPDWDPMPPDEVGAGGAAED